jgi:hypothetical protein
VSKLEEAREAVVVALHDWRLGHEGLSSYEVMAAIDKYVDARLEEFEERLVANGM